MSESSKTYAYFFVSEFDCSVQEITKLMGVSPTKSCNKGAPGAHVDTLPRSIWELHSTLARGEMPLQDHVENVLMVLEKRPEIVAKLGQQYTAGINCVGYYYSANPGLHLSAELIKRVAALDLSLDFDLYNLVDSASSD